MQRVRIGITGLAVVFLVVLLAAAIVGFHSKAKTAETGRLHGDVLEEEEAKAYPLMKDVNFDAAGRMILPERLRIKAEIGEEAFFVGRGRKFRIWNPDKLRANPTGESADVLEEMEDLLARRKDRG